MKIGIVTGKSGNTLVEALKSRGCEVYVITGDMENGGAQIADDFLLKFFNPTHDNIEDLKEICNWFKSKEIDGFILGTGVWFAHELANMLSNDFGIPISHNINYLGIFKDKLKTKQLFIDFGMETPNYQFMTTKSELLNMNFPFVVKSNIDLFPVWLCHSKESFNEFKFKIDDAIWNLGVLLEEYIEGNDVTVPVFATHNSVNAPSIVYWSKQEKYKLAGFESLTNDRLTIESSETIINQTKNLIEQTGYFGVSRFDIRISADKYYYLEVNSVVSIRQEGSSYEAMRLNGINYVEDAIAVYLENIKSSK